MLRGMLSEAQIAEYRERGFLVIPDLLTRAELDHYGPHVDEGVRNRRRSDRRPLAEKSVYEQSFQQCMNLWEDCPEVRPLTFHPLLAQAAAELAGVPALRVWHDQALYKEPGGRETDAHLDQAYWPIEETNNITAWIPFDGSTLEGGAMGYVPGSHRFGVRAFANIFRGEGFDLEHGPEARGVPPVWVEVPRGSVAFHHSLTIHAAKPNRTDRMRRVHTIIYFVDGSTRRARGEHFAVDRAHIAPGAPIRSEFTPLAWPREPGDLPPTPPKPLHSLGGGLPAIG
jgi:ectoine hydroxylase-related dioxygenase (phytanoyl-CoA dioxygenase family)